MSEERSALELEADREAVAGKLRQLADRIESGEPLPVGADEAALSATSPVGFTVRSRVSDGETAVRVDLTWAADRGGDRHADESGGSDRERGGTRRGAVDADDADGPADLATPEDDLPAPEAGTRNEKKAAHEFDRARHFAGKGKTRAADSRFRQAVEADPADAEIRRRYAEFLLDVGDARRAMAEFQGALAIAPEDPVLRVAVANAHWSLGNVERATEQFERALALSPEDPDVLSVYGRFCWEERGDVERAVEHLQTAIDADPDHALAHLNFAVLLREGGRDDRAETHYERALELGEGDATVHAEYGHYLWATGEVEEAARHYAKARELGAEVG
jgi:Tfp pilus assembly protein PilF